MSARFGVHFLRKTDNRFENRDIDNELLSYMEKQPAGEFFSLPMENGSPDIEENSCRFFSEKTGEAIYIAIQENVGLFHFEHWKKHDMVRRITYSNDAGWYNISGTPEDWEENILFSEEKLKLTLECYDPESHRKIKEIWTAKEVREGIFFPR
ncbi:MAG: hypothetical protein R2941_25170 [Desulfobacterales bacterium]